MGNYFVLECYGPVDEDRAVVGEIVDDGDVNWQLGRRFDTAVPAPIEVHLDPDQPGRLMPMFERSILLMTSAMVAALQAAGIDNLDVYPAVVIDTTSGAEYRDYQAVNIVGVLQAADLAKSVYDARGDSPLIDTDFDSLVIDESKAGSLLMFRLAECVTAKIVHVKVKEALEKEFPDLDFVVPEEWMG